MTLMSRGCIASIALFWIAVCWIVPPSARAQQNVINREWELKASYMYYFTQYIEWPEAQRGDTFVIGILGENPFGAYTRTLEGLRARGDKVIDVRVFASMEDYDPSCHVLFVSSRNATPDETLERVKEAARHPQTTHALIVADTPGSIQQGAAFDFYITENNRLRLRYNSRATDDADLVVQQRLSGLRSIDDVTPPERDGSR